MARQENKNKGENINKSDIEESNIETRENDFESGDNPEERERISGNIRK